MSNSNFYCLIALRIPEEPIRKWRDANTAVMRGLVPMPLQRVNPLSLGPHISLSKPFHLPSMHIEHFVSLIAQAIEEDGTPPFPLSLNCPDNLTLLSGSEASSSYVVIRTNHPLLMKLLKVINEKCAAFGLQQYYQEPIPHVSLWKGSTVDLRTKDFTCFSKLTVPLWVDRITLRIGTAHIDLALSNPHRRYWTLSAVLQCQSTGGDAAEGEFSSDDEYV